MRVLIIGCGYVGLSLGRELVREGHEVWGMRRSQAAAAEMTSAGIKPLVADITRPETLPHPAVPYDWVVNCVSSSGGDVDDYQQVYLEGTRHVLHWLAAAPPHQFVYTSSTSVYGQIDGSLVSETSPVEPTAETAKVLVETEKILLAATRGGAPSRGSMRTAERPFPAVILRLAGIYGPGRGYWLKQYLKGEAKIEGRGERFLNMIHRDDAVGAIIAALHHGEPGEIYNVVDDEPVRQIDFFQWLAAKSGRALPPFVPADPAMTRKRGLTDKRVSNRKLKQHLRYRLRYPTFRKGFEQLYTTTEVGAA